MMIQKISLQGHRRVLRDAGRCSLLDFVLRFLGSQMFRLECFGRIPPRA